MNKKKFNKLSAKDLIYSRNLETIRETISNETESMNYDNVKLCYPSTSSINQYVKAVRKGVLMVTCRVCGQCHAKNNNHLYDYEGPIDDDLICHICFQPFVNPIDSNCGCTYCYVCLKNYFKRYKNCPIDSVKLDSNKFKKASPALKKILDKLLVVCPNVDYCDEVLHRNLLENHLLNRCKGSVTYCTYAHLGCEFQGPRSALISHLQECTFNEITEDIYREPIIPGKLCQIELHRGYSNLGLFVVGGSDTPLGATVIQSIKPASPADRDGRLEPGDHILKLNGNDLTIITHKEVIELFSEAIPICRMTVFRDTLDESSNESYEYREDSLAEADGRLKVMDKILEINCQNVKNSTKEEAQKIISASSTLVSLLISREIEPKMPVSTLKYKGGTCSIRNKLGGFSNLTSIWQEYSLSLIKKKNEPLGITVDGGLSSFYKDNSPVYVSSIDAQTWIEKSKHIKKGDIIVKIDDKSLIGNTKEEAMELLKKTIQKDSVKIDYIRSQEIDSDSFRPTWKYFISIPIIYQIAKNVTIFKDSNEILGLTIAGGNETSFDKIFIKSVIPDSSAAKSKKLKSGDILISVNGVSLQNISHTDAIQYLKSACGMIKIVVISCPGTLI